MGDLELEVRCLLILLIPLPIKYKYLLLFNSIVDFIANAIAQTLLTKRTHKIVGRGKSRAMQFGNDQIIATVPREIARWKHIGKGILLRWSDGGENRVILRF